MCRQGGRPELIRWWLCATNKIVLRTATNDEKVPGQRASVTQIAGWKSHTDCRRARKDDGSVCAGIGLRHVTERASIKKTESRNRPGMNGHRFYSTILPFPGPSTNGRERIVGKKWKVLIHRLQSTTRLRSRTQKGP